VARPRTDPSRPRRPPPTTSQGRTRYAFDALNRLARVDHADQTPDVGLRYDAASRPVSVRDGFGEQRYAYDDLDRVTAIGRGSETFRYAYDPAGNATERSYPNGEAHRYAFDSDGLLSSVRTGRETTRYTRDAAGLPVSRKLANGFTERHRFDRAGRGVFVGHARGGRSLSSFAYGLDPVGNPVEVRTRLRLRRPRSPDRGTLCGRRSRGLPPLRL